MNLLLAAEAGAHEAPVDVLALLSVLVVAWAAGRLSERVGYPAVLGELAAGIVFGPPLLGLIGDGAGLDVIGELGIILMMLWIGTEIDLEDLKRSSRAGLYAAIGGFVVPFAGGLLVMRLFGFDWVAAVFVGAAVGVTSLATKSRILADLKLFDTRIAYVMMTGALLSDTATLVVFAGILSLAGGTGGGVAATGVVVLEAIAFFAIAGLAAAVAPRFGSWLRSRPGLDGPGWGLSVLVAMGLGGAAVAEVFGLHAILGSFVAGVVARRGLLEPRTEKQAADLLKRLSIGVLAPVFFTTAGFAISIEAVTSNVGLVLAVVAVATFGKIIGTALAYVPTGHGWREGVVVGGAMNGRGAVEIVVAGIGVEQGLISTEVFTVLVVMAVVTTASVPVLLKVGVEWLRGRGELADAGGARRDVTIIGAGPLAMTWAEVLGSHREVTLLDTNIDRVRRARAGGLQAVVGDATDVDALLRADADKAGLLLALTTNLEVNLIAGQLAREEFGVREVRIAMGATAHPSTVGLIERYDCAPLHTGADVERWSAWLDNGEATTTSLRITPRTDLDRVHERLRTGEDVLPVAVVRGDDAIPFPLIDQLRDGDRVVAIVREVVGRVDLEIPEVVAG